MSEARTFLVGAGPCEAPRLAQLAVLTEQGQCRRDCCGCSEGLLEAFEQRKAVAWFYVVKTRPVVRARSGRRGNATAGMSLGLGRALCTSRRGGRAPVAMKLPFPR